MAGIGFGHNANIAQIIDSMLDRNILAKKFSEPGILQIVGLNFNPLEGELQTLREKTQDYKSERVLETQLVSAFSQFLETYISQKQQDETAGGAVGGAKTVGQTLIESLRENMLWVWNRHFEACSEIQEVQAAMNKCGVSSYEEFVREVVALASAYYAIYEDRIKATETSKQSFEAIWQEVEENVVDFVPRILSFEHDQFRFLDSESLGSLKIINITSLDLAPYFNEPDPGDKPAQLKKDFLHYLAKKMCNAYLLTKWIEYKCPEYTDSMVKNLKENTDNLLKGKITKYTRDVILPS